MRSELEVGGDVGTEYLADDHYDQVSQSHSYEGTDNRRPQTVEGALGQEGPHQVAALHADRPGDAHLALPLRRQHGEDQEYQQQPDADGEEAEGGEQRYEYVPHLVRYLHDPLLDAEHLQACFLKSRQVVEPVDDLVCQCLALEVAALVRYEDGGQKTRLAQ